MFAILIQSSRNSKVSTRKAFLLSVTWKSLLLSATQKLRERRRRKGICAVLYGKGGLCRTGMLYRRTLLKLLSLDVAGYCNVLYEPVHFIPGHPRIQTETCFSESAGLLLLLRLRKSFCQHRCIGQRSCLRLCQ